MADDFFIGWAEDNPKADRRAFLSLALLGTLGAAGAAFGLAHAQNPPGPGAWDQAEVRNWTGLIAADPYPTLRTLDFDGTPRTLLLGSQGKCGVRERASQYAGGAVTVRASPVVRGREAYLALVDGAEWVHPAARALDPRLAPPPPVDEGPVVLDGEILDAKCWLGAMRPGHGKTHKACAALCIRSGAPPLFFTEGRADMHHLLLVDSRGGPAVEVAARHAGEPVTVSGRIVRLGDLRTLRLDDMTPRAMPDWPWL